MTSRERAVSFLRATHPRAVDQVESFPWGALYVTPTLPRIWDANFAVVERWDAGVADLLRELERAQGGAGFAHRRTVVVDEELAGRLWPEIGARGDGYSSRYLLMEHARPPDRPADTSIEVLGLGDVDWALGRQALMAGEYDDDLDTIRQLVELDRRLTGAMNVRHLGAFVDGDIAAYAALYLEDGVAQVEDVATLPAYRGRGLARGVVLHAVAEARRNGAELVFLVTAEADWPKHLYMRLGFDSIGVEHVFGRPPRDDSDL